MWCNPAATSHTDAIKLNNNVKALLYLFGPRFSIYKSFSAFRLERFAFRINTHWIIHIKFKRITIDYCESLFAKTYEMLPKKLECNHNTSNFSVCLSKWTLDCCGINRKNMWKEVFITLWKSGFLLHFSEDMITLVVPYYNFGYHYNSGSNINIHHPATLQTCYLMAWIGDASSFLFLFYSLLIVSWSRFAEGERALVRLLEKSSKSS